jgi:hypothetical protein
VKLIGARVIPLVIVARFVIVTLNVVSVLLSSIKLVSSVSIVLNVNVSVVLLVLGFFNPCNCNFNTLFLSCC